MPRRPRSYAAVAGVAVGALAVGVLLPAAIDGEARPPLDSVSSGGAVTPDGALDGASLTDPVVGGPHITRDTPSGAPTEAVSGTVDGVGAPGDSQERPAPAGDAAPVVASASDVGVTASTIKVGVVLLDFTTTSAVGLSPAEYTLENQRKSYQAQFDAINAGGGIHGRQISAVYAQADPFRGDSALAACVSLTEDHKVFTVLAFAGFTMEGMRCVAKQHETPIVVMSGYTPTETFVEAGGLLVAEGMAGNRLMLNWVAELDRLGMLKDRKIGLVGSRRAGQGDRQNMEHGLLPALDRFGYEVTYRTELSEDLHTGASQIPVEVNQMRAAGVDTVFLVVTFAQAVQWVQAADAQGWTPQYHVSDHQGLAACESCLEPMPESFNDAVGFTVYHSQRGIRERRSESQADRVCRETYNRMSGEQRAYGDEHPFSSACVQTTIFERATTAAGPNPTRAGWAAAVQTLGDFPLAGLLGGGFTGKSDYADVLMRIRWDSSCRCYRPAEEPRRARF